MLITTAEAELVLFDENGIELSPDAMRSVRAGFLFGEQKPTLDAELGIIGNLNGLEEAYEQRLLCGIRRELMLNNKRTLLLQCARTVRQGDKQGFAAARLEC